MLIGSGIEPVGVEAMRTGTSVEIDCHW